MSIFFLKLIISGLAEMEPLVVQKDTALSQSQTKDMQIRSLSFIKLETVFDNKTNISPKLTIALVNVKIYLVEDSSEVHRLRDNFEVFRTIISDWVNWLAEKNTIMDV